MHVSSKALQPQMIPRSSGDFGDPSFNILQLSSPPLAAGDEVPVAASSEACHLVTSTQIPEGKWGQSTGLLDVRTSWTAWRVWPAPLAVGLLIRAFYIIIFIPYLIIWECYLHCYINVLHVLDDL